MSMDDRGMGQTNATDFSHSYPFCFLYFTFCHGQWPMYKIISAVDIVLKNCMKESIWKSPMTCTQTTDTALIIHT